MPITINGTGTITGISAGGYPDATITADDLHSTLDLSGKTLTLPSGVVNSDLKVKAVTTKVQTFSGNIITTSGGYTDTGVFINHTPTSTNAKLVISVSARLSSAYGSFIDHFYRLRNGNNANITSQQFVFRVQTGNGALHLSITDIWEPNSTNQQTIKLFAAQGSGTSTQLVSPVVMSVFEVES